MELLLSKFTQQVNKIFKYFPKPLELRAFDTNDLPLLLSTFKKVHDVSIQYNLNKSQTRALAELNSALESEFPKMSIGSRHQIISRLQIDLYAN